MVQISQAKPKTAKPKTKAEQLEAAAWHQLKRPGSRRQCIAARKLIVEIYTPFVRAIARKMAKNMPPNMFDEEDLAAEGMLGMFGAMKRFDPGRGLRFKTFSGLRIRGAMVDAIRNADWIPRLVRTQHKQLIAASEKLEDKLGRTPTDEELQKEMQIDAAELVGYKLNAIGLTERGVINLESITRPRGDAGQVQQQHADRKSVSPGADIELRDSFHVILRTLSVNERHIIDRYYRGHKTMKEISGELGLSESRVSQIHKGILIHLRRRLERESKGEPCNQKQSNQKQSSTIT